MSHQRLSVESRFHPGFREEHAAPRFAEPGRPTRFPVPVEPPDPLQQHVDRADVGEQQVGVDVERLFQRLRADHDRPAPRPVRLAEHALDGFVQAVPIFGREPAVMQRRSFRNLQHDVFAALRRQRLEDRLRARDGVADHQYLRAFPRRGKGGCRDCVRIFENRFAGHLDRLARVAGIDCAGLRRGAAAREGERRVGDAFGVSRRRRRRSWRFGYEP